MSSATNMTAGVHLPQAGPAASEESMRRVALRAEELGFADVWVSDHLVVPSDGDYPHSAYLYDPLVTLGWIGACTKRVGLGTSVLVVPMRNPAAVAKALGSLDRMSGGRVIFGAAPGWCEPEFDAIGVPFRERGKRTDEALEIIRTLWTEDHITRDYPAHGARLRSIRMKPQPAHAIPVWIGGHADVALRRAVRSGDGWHGAFLPPKDAKPLVERLRELGIGNDFTLSMRTNRDPQIESPELILDEIEGYRALGFRHLVVEPRQKDADEYLRSVEQLAALLEQAGVQLQA